MISQPLPGLFLLKFEEFLSKRNTWNKCSFFFPSGEAFSFVVSVPVRTWGWSCFSYVQGGQSDLCL